MCSKRLSITIVFKQLDKGVVLVGLKGVVVNDNETLSLDLLFNNEKLR